MTEFQPVFNFEGNLTAQEDIDTMLAEAENKSGGNSIFRPGSHTLQVTGLEIKGPTQADPAWMKVVVKFAGVGKMAGKKISTMLLVPTSGRLTYQKDGEESIFPFKSLCDNLAALGITLTRENVGSIIPQYFAPKNLKVLVGKTCVAEIGYRGAYAQGVKSDDGSRQVQLVNYGEAVKDDTGTVVLFKGDDAYADAEAYCRKLGITYANFPDILSLAASEDSSVDSTGTSW